MAVAKNVVHVINQNAKVASNFICVPDGHTFTTLDQLLTGA